MRFLKYLFFGVIIFSNVLSQVFFNLDGPFDINKNGEVEVFIINGDDKSIKWVELNQLSKQKELWSFNLPISESFIDFEIIDINKDGYVDIIALLDVKHSIKEKDWLYVFLGNENSFSDSPIKAKYFEKSKNYGRPSNLTIISGDTDRLVVALGATIREVMIFELIIKNNKISFSNVEYISDPNTNNGYGAYYVGSFSNKGVQYLSLLSCEKNEIKISTFDIEGKNRFINSSIYSLDNTKTLLGSAIQSINIKSLGKNGIIIPFQSNEVYILSIVNKKPVLLNTNIKSDNIYPSTFIPEKNLASKVIKNRFNLNILDSQEIIPHSIYSRLEKGVLLPPDSPIDGGISTLNSKLNYSEENHTSLPNDKKDSNYSLLSPTLGDFLYTVKDNKPVNESDIGKVIIPNIDNDMESMSWADEAGFTKLNLDDYSTDDIKSDTIKFDIPNLNNRMDITELSKKSWNKNINRNEVDSIKSNIKTDNKIDLYYVLAITSASEKRDRFIFDGEVPFGVSVNQIPPTGKATHFKHGVSANLESLSRGNEFDFAYSLRNAQKDSITTLKMVHDMQTNLVYMKRSIIIDGIEKEFNDTDTKSYQPEAFDPKLFEFPNYFFEGFPTSLDMDFADKLIRFSFDDKGDSLYNGIYLSTTTPSDPSQSLAVFMEEGRLQAIRGEIEVYPNGKKRITTEFDLVGVVQPKVLFSHLIEEEFSEELKVKLLQGASLEEPLFGPAGKLPKVSRQPRLPEAQPDQPEFEIPITPKQSNIPKENEINISKTLESKNDSISKKIKTSLPGEMINLKKLEEPPVPSDSLKLENVKIPIEDIQTPDLKKKKIE